MNKLIVTSLCCIVTLQAMEESQHRIVINKPQSHHIPAMIDLSNQVIVDFFKPTMHKAFPEYDKEVIESFFDGVPDFFDDFFKKVTADTENNNYVALIASDAQEPDAIIGLCTFIKQNKCLYLEYLIISQQLRGKGIGKALVSKALSMYNDITECELVTFARNNEGTQKFYEKLGFTTTRELYTIKECMSDTHIKYHLAIAK